LPAPVGCAKNTRQSASRMELSYKDVVAVSGALRELYAHTDAPTLPHCVVKLLHGLIAADSAAYQSFDFRTGEMQVVHDHDPRADQYLPALNEHIREHPLIVHLGAHWQEGAAIMSEVVSRRRLRDMAIHTEWLHPVGIVEQLGLVVEDCRYGTTALSLQRKGRDFSGRDKQVLTFLQPHFMQAFKNAADMTAAKTHCARLEEAVSACRLGVVWLAENLAIDWMSSQARQWLGAYFGTQGRHGKALPAQIMDWVRRQREIRRSKDALVSQAALTVDGKEGRLTIRWICEGPERSYLLLAEERSRPGILMGLGLTARESEVLHWLAEGKTNEAIAIILGIALRTVEKHVENILAKLGVENRVEAVLRAREPAATMQA
jgi:DNA-binding CsgD family transcriptional regulator